MNYQLVVLSKMCLTQNHLVHQFQSVPVNELSACPVSISEHIEELFVFPASLVSWVFPGPSFCQGSLIRLAFRGGLLLHLLQPGGLLSRSGGLLLRLLQPGGLLPCSGGLLLQPGGLLSRSCGLLLCLLQPGGLLSCSGGLLLRLLQPGGLLLPALLVPPWFSALPWLPALPASSWFSTPPWLPALPVSPGYSALPQSPVPPLPRGTASGSRSLGGAMSQIWSMNFRSLTTSGHLLSTWTLTLHRLLHYTLDYISHHPLH